MDNATLAALAAARARIRARLDHGTVWSAPKAKGCAVVTREDDGWKVTRVDHVPDMAAVVDLLVEHYGDAVVQAADHARAPSGVTVT